MEKIAYRPREAAEAIGVSRTLIDRLIRSGKLRATMVGGCRVIARSELERLVREGDEDGTTVHVTEGVA